MTLEEEVVALRAENASLRAEIERLRAELAQAPELIAQLQARIAELERRKTPPPPFVRPATPPPEQKPRKTRASQHNAGRPREEPRQIVLHALERCPDCGYLLRGQSVARTRQVIELPEQAPVLAQARASPIVHMDETGWREDGQNGYVWGLVTPGPEPVCSYAYDPSHAGAVATTLLPDFAGHLVTDYNAAYNQVSSKHQRCWSHLVRALHALKTDHAAEAAVVAWAQAVQALYADARAAFAGPTVLTARQRTLLARQLNAQAFRLGVVYAGVKV